MNAISLTNCIKYIPLQDEEGDLGVLMLELPGYPTRVQSVETQDDFKNVYEVFQELEGLHPYMVRAKNNYA